MMKDEDGFSSQRVSFYLCRFFTHPSIFQPVFLFPGHNPNDPCGAIQPFRVLTLQYSEPL
jgi:hypothetical protein